MHSITKGYLDSIQSGLKSSIDHSKMHYACYKTDNVEMFQVAWSMHHDKRFNVSMKTTSVDDVDIYYLINLGPFMSVNRSHQEKLEMLCQKSQNFYDKNRLRSRELYNLNRQRSLISIENILSVDLDLNNVDTFDVRTESISLFQEITRLTPTIHDYIALDRL